MLLDTCILIDYLRRTPEAVAYIRAVKDDPEISFMTAIELHGSIKHPREKKEVDTLLASCEVFYADEPITRQACALYQQYSKSHGIDIPDAIIAATALVHDLQLVTNNRKHFPMVKKLTVPYERSKR